MRPGGILALDLNSVTGWAHGFVGDEAPEWGAWKLPMSDGRGHGFNALDAALEAFIVERQPAFIAYEAPMSPNSRTGHFDDATVSITYGCAAIVEACSARLEIPSDRLIRRAVDTYRGAVIGRTRLTDEEKRIRPKLTVKTAIVAPWIAGRGWKISDHNARDAAIIWAYEVGIRHEMFRKRRAA